MNPGLRLYNTLTRRKEDFAPIDPANVRMYVCGPTVYDQAHIGNARPVVVFDVLFRLLRHLYGAEHVTYVRNITDIDDKINARAAERGIDIRTLTDATTQQFHADAAALGCLPPTVEPRATEHIAEMRALIERLAAADHAYVAADHVLFSVPSMADYGRLSRRPLDEMVAGARVDVAPYKRDAADFVLWKPSRPGEPAWPSPLNIAVPGRPGWHIECSAMAWKHLGETFDIHAGGVDLVFPHHENEVAQSRCAFGAPVMANYWLHNGFLQVEGEKMAKSRGNFVTIRDLLRGWRGQPWAGSVLRWAMLTTHYRQPIDWTLARLEESRDLVTVLANVLQPTHFMDDDLAVDSWSDPLEIDNEFLTTLKDDINTPAALGWIGAHVRTLDSADDAGRRNLIHVVRLLGLFDENRRDFLDGVQWGRHIPPQQWDNVSRLVGEYRVYKANNDDQMAEGIRTELDQLQYKLQGPNGVVYVGTDKSLTQLIGARAAARAAKNWAEADRIRDELAELGIALKDNKDGTTSAEPKR